MTTKQAIELFGSVRKLAEALDIWPTAIYRWGKKPPLVRQYEIQAITKGKLKVD